jgi:PEP-CTERM motif-containing protein
MKNLPARTLVPPRSTACTSEVPSRRKRIVSLSLLTAMAVALSAGRLLADPLPPTNLPPGTTQYEILFETAAKTNATSKDINTYNAFVQSQVTPALAALDPASDWHAIANTTFGGSPATNAPSVAGIPVYTPTGLLITNLGLYTANSLNTFPDVTQNGTVDLGDSVWTGAVPRPLGGPLTIGEIGFPGDISNGGWLNTAEENLTDLAPLYALSGPIDVPNSTPEPASLALFGTGLLAVGAVRVVRRRRTLGPTCADNALLDRPMGSSD